ncbi:MAG: protein-L-isoaspartate O-methyltransferase family protein [Paracoccus sp. (in: a-proteobacteria)]|jgi:protein-L-isoaspartate(D-aspartate) O-methyltransferase|uniref:protein-L-isoaspartate O-methyltransferase family protein n=1 Tax=unclassified Paracoccus (in: a-proteobacteria) TaxID=2688777 RepID=UPI000C48D2E4|nr:MULTISPECIES: protein-L-isoaspartate O-methyltransferase [unclassified Paracoccus (in: a-proteobacteria)]MAN55897.1 protein-L-isoaspartate O-methyltransferase [Paracoccus sp. (in: a-proteobacteria)]MBA48183.1 protein-L-isoaspartate O-methyltransferase [Paracoccus sp. (in: a-proteobacteria)]MBA49826.1 protein-L-isoaspartate O-methyltransferase [Paracoccus sp. (in: a-proteobacteria)]MDB2551742.1 protein-L-isoaspartate O-methyltransferase [Paracoccus sp. (in: a-proteobacteria)]HIC67881.1 prote|tara:strand:- start:587 stop:1240 length:654 start_codon:yes stop_codon:yes gene_type:complete
MTDFAARRTMMVDTQVRPNDVTKFPVIEAMLAVPREEFVPAGRRAVAYSGENLDIGRGRVLLEPRTLAKMVDALDIQPDDLILDLGCGYGYSAAVMARMAEAVVAIEDDADMAAEAERRLAEADVFNVAVLEGPLSEGAARQGPYDAILIEGAVQQVPAAIEDQLKEGGRIAALFDEGRLGVVRIGHRLNDRVNWRYAFNAHAPLLPGFTRERRFSL